jgi:ubiquinone/menaquinone biosynthesis C-methylase UbiE
MDNSLLYTADEQYREFQNNSYLDDISEFYRILKPSGRLLVTVPFGLPQNFGWLLQFDSQRLDQLIKRFGSSLKSKIFYKYSSMGWNIASEKDCIKCEYFDVHSSSGQYASDLAAAARSVVCLEFFKDI